MSHTITKLGKDRMQTLINAVRDLPRERFDYSSFQNDCGTTVCAAGHLPELFPGEWEWNAGGFPALKDTGDSISGYGGELFFGIDSDIVEAIFCGFYLDLDGDNVRCQGGCGMSDTTPDQWADFAQRVLDSLEVVG